MDQPISTRRGLAGKWRWSLGTLLVLVVAGAVATPSIKRWMQADRTLAAGRVRIGVVTRGPFVRDAVAQGKVVAALHPTLFSPTSGIVTLHTRAGASVTKGQLLARIDSPELRSRLAQELATLRSVESSFERQKIALRQASREREQQIELLDLKQQAASRARLRADQLVAQGLLGATDHDKAKDDERIAAMEWNNAKEAIALEAESTAFELKDRSVQVQRQQSVVGELQRQADQLSIVAPVDGSVANVAVQDRDAVAANQALLTVVNLDQYEVEIKLSESDAADASLGTAVTIDYEGKPFRGKVTAISPEVRDSQVTGTADGRHELLNGLRKIGRSRTIYWVFRIA
ncbi:MAG: efflux RND transporter periplasmic adaptor subunit [Acidobacteriota bacterium]